MDFNKQGRRPKREYRTSSMKYFKEYKKLHPESELTKEQYKLIAYGFGEKVSRFITSSGKRFKLPHGIGEVSIKKRKKSASRLIEDGTFRDTRPMDMGATMKLWANDKEAREKKTIIRHDNEHSNGYVARLHWHRVVSRFSTKHMWIFRSTRFLQRQVLAKSLKENPRLFDFYQEK